MLENAKESEIEMESSLILLGHFERQIRINDRATFSFLFSADSSMDTMRYNSWAESQ